MLIKNLESKVNLAKTISLGVIVLCFSIVVAVLYFMNNEIDKIRGTIYVLNQQGIPQIATSENPEEYKELEYKNHIETYHNLFFNLVPDEKQIEYNMNKAMYMVDESGIQQYNNLKEKGYYTQILSSSSVLSIQKDSILLDMKNKRWRFYGKQKIDRKSSTVLRTLITEGGFKDIPRSSNNVHGVLISNWKTVENKDIELIEKGTL